MGVPTLSHQRMRDSTPTPTCCRSRASYPPDDFSWALWPNLVFREWCVPAHPLVKFISHTGCGGDLPTRSCPTRGCREIYSVLSGSRQRLMFHLAHGGCLRRGLLTRLRIDGCSMSLPGIHIAHGELSRPIDFARGHGFQPTTPLLNSSID